MWQSVLPLIGVDAGEIKAARNSLATLVLDLARDGQLDALQITHTAARLMREALGKSKKPHTMIGVRLDDGAGRASLSICEALLRLLADLTVISKNDARDVLTDVATTHQEAAITSQSPEDHQAVIAIVQRILAGRSADGGAGR